MAKPAILTLDRWNFVRPHLGPPSKILWEYYDSATEQWTEPIEVSVSADGKFLIPISHFSDFRATTIEYDGLSQGGQ